MDQPQAVFLLVEDNDFDAEAFQRGLKKRDLEQFFVRARDGKEALDILRGTHATKLSIPFIIILDLNMPGMNGFEFLRELRNDQLIKGSVVFVLTTSENELERDRCYQEFNIAGYLHKANAGEGFNRIMDMLIHYCQAVSLPKQRSL